MDPGITKARHFFMRWIRRAVKRFGKRPVTNRPIGPPLVIAQGEIQQVVMWSLPPMVTTA